MAGKEYFTQVQIKVSDIGLYHTCPAELTTDICVMKPVKMSTASQEDLRTPS